MSSFLSDFSTGCTKIENNSNVGKMQDAQTSPRLLFPELSEIDSNVICILELQVIKQEKENELKKIISEESKSMNEISDLKEELNEYYEILNEVTAKHDSLNVRI